MVVAYRQYLFLVILIIMLEQLLQKKKRQTLKRNYILQYFTMMRLFILFIYLKLLVIPVVAFSFQHVLFPAISCVLMPGLDLISESIIKQSDNFLLNSFAFLDLLCAVKR